MFEEFIENLDKKYNPEKIILFGSRAWGNASQTSDYDVLVIMNESDLKSTRLASKIIQDCHPGDIAIDLLVRTSSEVKDRLELGDPLIKQIMTKGKTLYEKNSSRVD